MLSCWTHTMAEIAIGCQESAIGSDRTPRSDVVAPVEAVGAQGASREAIDKDRAICPSIRAVRPGIMDAAG